MLEFKARFTALLGDVQTVIDRAIVDDDAAALHALRSIDDRLVKLNQDVTAFDDKAVAKDKLHALAHNAAMQASFALLVVGFATVLVSIGFAVWMSVSQVSGPSIKLGATMRELAAGDFTVDIVGQGRADEIGGMAKAVQVFKDNGLKLQVSETAAEAMRFEAKAERRRADELQAEEARRQQLAVEAIARGLAAARGLQRRIGEMTRHDEGPVRQYRRHPIGHSRDQLGLRRPVETDRATGREP